MLNKDDGSFKPSDVKAKYGVISVELASDESYGQAIASELQDWTITAPNADGFNMKREGNAEADRIISRYTAGLAFNSGAKTYSLINDASQRNQVASVKDTKTNDSGDPLTPVFKTSSSSFSIPSILLDAALKKYEGASGLFEGVFSPKGEMVNLNLMIKGSLGKFGTQPVATQILNRNIGVEIQSGAALSVSGEYRLQGIEYTIREGRPGVQASMINGVLSLSDTTGKFNVTTQDVSLNANNDFFGVSVREEQSKGSLIVTSMTDGRIKITDSETTLEGYISPDKKRIVLRMISKKTLDSSVASAAQADEARHGYLIASLIEDQPAQ